MDVEELVHVHGGEAGLRRERRGDRFAYRDGVDALLDLVNYAPGTYDTALKEGAHVASPTGAAGAGPGRSNVMATPTAENLQRLGALLTDGTLRIPVQQTHELAQAPEALAALAGQHTQGKLAVRVR